MGPEPLYVDTKLASKNLAHHFAFVPVFSQKKFVCLMFACEKEEREIRTVLEEARGAGGVASGELR